LQGDFRFVGLGPGRKGSRSGLPKHGVTIAIASAFAMRIDRPGIRSSRIP
jgi:hypothetical protein